MGLAGTGRMPKWLRNVVDLIWPARCAGCGGPVESEGPLCGACDGRLRELAAAPRCARCAGPLAQEGDGCPWCRGKGLPHYDCIVTLCVYDEPVRAMIHRMKYGGAWGLAEHLADLLWERSRTRELLAGADALVPVPLHFWRQFRRGYNQAEVLARRLAHRSGRPCLRAVARIRHTESQVQLHSQQARRQNVRGAFALRRSGSVRDRRIVVIDDLTTTGATLVEVARALKSGGPAGLCALTVAAADPRGRDFRAV